MDFLNNFFFIGQVFDRFGSLFSCLIYVCMCVSFVWVVVVCGCVIVVVVGLPVHMYNNLSTTCQIITFTNKTLKPSQKPVPKPVSRAPKPIRPVHRPVPGNIDAAALTY